jgi:ABC-type transport system substrate-binding protein
VVEAHGEAWTEVGNIVTNGPFGLQAWERGQSIVLVRNPLYHGRVTGNVQRMELSLLWGTPGQLEMYEADELDVLFVWGLPFEVGSRLQLFARIKQRYPEEFFPIPGAGIGAVVFDVARPPFDDIRVRRAFVLATDRETMAHVTTGGMNSPATGGFVPHLIPGHSPGIGLPYDPEQARQLLAEAGYPGGRHFPEVTAIMDAGHVPYAEYLRTQWRHNLHVDMSWQIGEWADFLSPGEIPQVGFGGCTFDYPDPASFLTTGFLSETGWRNKTFDSLVERARREMDPVQRMKLYRQADKILVEEAVILPIIYGQVNMLVKPWVKRLSATPFGWWLWKNVIIEPH